jgi:hypothetical protein
VEQVDLAAAEDYPPSLVAAPAVQCKVLAKVLQEAVQQEMVQADFLLAVVVVPVALDKLGSRRLQMLQMED